MFLADQLTRGLTPDQVLGRRTGLLAEYAGAEGYGYSWGKVVEQSYGSFMIWRIVPVAMWERLWEARQKSSLFIWDLLSEFQSMVRPILQDKLPSGLVITGCQGGGRRYHHALFSLLLVEPLAIEVARQWFSRAFLLEILPPLLAAVEQHTADLLHNSCASSTRN